MSVTNFRSPKQRISTLQRIYTLRQVLQRPNVTKSASDKIMSLFRKKAKKKSRLTPQQS